MDEEGAREVTLAWAPPGVPSMLATKYLRSIPQEHLSIQVRERHNILTVLKICFFSSLKEMFPVSSI